MASTYYNMRQTISEQESMEPQMMVTSCWRGVLQVHE